MWSTRNVASMNDIDIDERRLRIGRRGGWPVVILANIGLVTRSSSNNTHFASRPALSVMSQDIPDSSASIDL